MSAITLFTAGESSENVARLRFRRPKGRIEPSVLARQSALALLAFQAFETREAALSFINDENGALGGRPIEIAGGSETGFTSVRKALLAENEHDNARD